jgi:hypothetical protein
MILAEHAFFIRAKSHLVPDGAIGTTRAAACGFSPHPAVWGNDTTRPGEVRCEACAQAITRESASSGKGER